MDVQIEKLQDTQMKILQIQDAAKAQTADVIMQREQSLVQQGM